MPPLLRQGAGSLQRYRTQGAPGRWHLGGKSEAEALPADAVGGASVTNPPHGSPLKSHMWRATNRARWRIGGPTSRRAAVCEDSRDDRLRHAGEVVRQDGGTIAYDVAGDGPPVIFLHGLTSRRQGWDPVTCLLAPAFTCIRIDLRGHGESTPAPDYELSQVEGRSVAALRQVSKK
jgi:Alpha/beta hydrolase family